MAWSIILHGLSMVFRNLSDALKVSVGPMLAALLLVALLASLAGQPMQTMPGFGMGGGIGPGMGQPGPLEALVSLLSILVLLFVFSWVAVAWHRFVLLEEYPGLLPAINGRPILAYLGRSLLLALVLVVVMVPVGLLIGLVGAPLGVGRTMTGTVLGGLVIGVIGTYVWLRLAVLLPGVAVGKPMSLGAAWAATGKISSTIIGISFILVGVNLVVGWASAQLLGSGLIGDVIDLAVTWVTVMVGVSVLTTLYGHVIEGRPLAGG